MKRIVTTYSPSSGHRGGNGLPVETLFSNDRKGANNITSFLLLDYAGPATFSPTRAKRGGGQHPHRGFETVTLVCQGKLEHRDTSEGVEILGEDDLQWIAAGSVIVHEQFSSRVFVEKGGLLEVVQLWFNLPAKTRNIPAAYQSLLDAEIPKVSVGTNTGELRVIAGEFKGHRRPAKPYTPINVWDIKLEPCSNITVPAPQGHTSIIVVVSGMVSVNQSEVLHDAETASFERNEQDISVESNNHAHILMLTGSPIDEPVVGHGPFVMNTKEEIGHAIIDFRSGKFGLLDR